MDAAPSERPNTSSHAADRACCVGRTEWFVRKSHPDRPIMNRSGVRAGIARAIIGFGLTPADLDRVVLIHFHDDHTGTAAKVGGWSEVTVMAHHREARSSAVAGTTMVRRPAQTAILCRKINPSVGAPPASLLHQRSAASTTASRVTSAPAMARPYPSTDAPDNGCANAPTCLGKEENNQ